MDRQGQQVMDRDERGEDRPENMICMEEKVAMIEERKLRMRVGGGCGKPAVTTELDCRLCYASL